MRKSILLFLLVLPILTFGACKDKPASVTPDTATAEKQVEPQSTPPASTGETNGGVNLKLQVVAVQRAVLEFRTANGQFPSSLEELQTSANLDFDVSKYDYDPEHGRVSLKQ